MPVITPSIFYTNLIPNPGRGQNMTTCGSCHNETLESFTFSTGETISQCKSCGYRRGHEVLRQGTVDNIQHVATDLKELWMDMLFRQGFGEEAGKHPVWLVYGHHYVEDDRPHDYTDRLKPARKNGKNYTVSNTEPK